MNRYWISGLFQDAKPTTDYETIVYDAIRSIADNGQLTGNELTMVEEELRHAMTAAERNAIRKERAKLDKSNPK